VVTAINTGITSIAIPAGSDYGGATVTKASTSILADGNTKHASFVDSGSTQASGSSFVWTPSGPPTASTATAYGVDGFGVFFTLTDNYVIANEHYWSAVAFDTGHGSHSTLTATCTWSATLALRRYVYNCRHNFYQRLMTIAGGDVLFLTSIVSDLKGSVQFRDPDVTETTVTAPRQIPVGTGSTGTGISDKAFDDYILSSTSGTPARTAWDTDLAAMNAILTSTRTTLTNQSRTGDENNNGVNPGVKGSEILTSSPDIDAAWTAFTGENTTLLGKCTARTYEVDARIGIPKYNGSTASRGSPPSIYVEDIPSSNTSGGQIPYGRSIYNNVNHLLGQDVDLLGGIVKDIESLTDLIGMVETARNKYNIFSGDDKAY
jgi:hypothetical protein